MLEVQSLISFLYCQGACNSQGRKSTARPVFTSQKVLNLQQIRKNFFYNMFLLVKILAVFIVFGIVVIFSSRWTKIRIENIWTSFAYKSFHINNCFSVAAKILQLSHEVIHFLQTILEKNSMAIENRFQNIFYTLSNFLHISPPPFGKVWEFKICLLIFCSLSKSQKARAKIYFQFYFPCLIQQQQKITISSGSPKHQVKASKIWPSIKMISLCLENFLQILLGTDNDTIYRSQLHLKYRTIDLQ